MRSTRRAGKEEQETRAGVVILARLQGAARLELTTLEAAASHHSGQPSQVGVKTTFPSSQAKLLKISASTSRHTN